MLPFNFLKNPPFFSPLELYTALQFRFSGSVFLGSVFGHGILSREAIAPATRASPHLPSRDHARRKCGIMGL
jgi:hypothetical protein